MSDDMPFIKELYTHGPAGSVQVAVLNYVDNYYKHTEPSHYLEMPKSAFFKMASKHCVFAI